MANLKITGQIPGFNRYDFDPIFKSLAEEGWDISKKAFFNVLMGPDGIPAESGSTKESFVHLAGKYGASTSIILSGKPPNDHGPWDDVSEDNYEDYKNGLLEWKLFIPARPFFFNEYASNYVKYWTWSPNDPDAELEPWTDREVQHTEPWGLLLEAKGVMLPIIRREFKRALKSAGLTTINRSRFTGGRLRGS